MIIVVYTTQSVGRKLTEKGCLFTAHNFPSTSNRRSDATAPDRSLFITKLPVQTVQLARLYLVTSDRVRQSVF
ncbi:MAG: hypothetical protein SAK29_29875 [Scytonema sp. PMC 1069.18]|nr:hypothetical protein [Scytonema sp. PMC 1069.18]MEC4884075.1 hypothetical protein [Scytonema sp. PMC 1070.18]